MELFKLLGTIAIEGADSANQQIDSITKKAETLVEQIGNKFENVGKSISNLGTKMTLGITTPLTLIGKSAISATADFESAMSEVSAISGATGEDFALLEKKAKEMGEKTKFSATESAEALKYMAMAGWKTEDMLNGLEGIMNLAAASGENLGSTSDIVTDALTAFGMSASDSGKFADILASASSNANTNVSMMGETFKYIAPVAGALGYSAEDTALAIGLMANSGIKASQAGTSLRSSLTNLADPTKEMMSLMVQLGLATTDTANIIDGGKLLKAQQKVEDKTIALEKAQIKYNTAVEKYGMESSQAQTAALDLEKAQLNLERAIESVNEAQMGSAEVTGINNNLLIDSSGNMRSLRDVMKTLRDSFSKLSAEEQAQAAATLFGKEAMSGMLAIINSSDDDFEKLASAIDGCEGSAQKMADTMNDNLSGQITLLKSQLEGLSIQFVTLIMPYLKEFVKKLSDVCTWVSNLDDGTKKLVLAISGIAAVTGPVLIVIGKISSGIGAVIKGGSALIAGFGKVSSAITGVIGIGGKLLTGIASIGSKILSVLIPAITSINPVVLAIIAGITALVAIGVSLYKNWDEISKWGSEAWESIKKSVGNAVESISGFLSDCVSKVGKFKEDFVSGIKDLKEKVSEKFQELKEAASQKVSELKESIVSKAVELKEKASEAFTGIADKAVEGFNNLREKGSTAISNLSSAFKTTFGNMLNTVIEKASVFAEKFAGPIEAAKDKVGEIVENIKSFFNFDWKLPDIKLPHFDISWDSGGVLGNLATMIGLPGLPKLDVEWYKDGGIMTDPTAFGFNPYSGKVMAGGEAGAEAIAPISTLQSYVQEAVSESNYQVYQVMNQMLSLMTQYFPQMANTQLLLDTGALVGELAEPMNEELGKITYMRGRWK